MGICESDNNKTNSSRCFCCGEGKNIKNNNYNNGNQNSPNQSQNFDNTSLNPPLQNEIPVNTNNKYNISGSNLTKNFPINNKKRDLFINNFINKNLDSFNQPNLRDGLLIKTQKKIMKISENSIITETECILSAKFDNPNVYCDHIWFPLDYKVNELRSKEVYVDDIKINDYNFESKETLIKINLGKTSNGQSRKFKVIYELEKIILNYGLAPLILSADDTYMAFLIYGEGNIQIDDVSNKNFVLDKELNLAHFEGKSTREIGYINYSKKINFKIYEYIPELKELESQIINKNSTKTNSISALAIYKKIVITDYGQEVHHIFKVKLINCNPGTSITTYSLGLMQKTKYSVDSVLLNGKNVEHSTDNALITIKNFGILNNQYAEIEIKYKYLFNLDKSIIRKENIITSNTKDALCKISLIIPENYVVLSSKEIFKKSDKNNNEYFYNGICGEESLHEYFEFCYKKAIWDIYKEFTLSSAGNIGECTFKMKRLFKGGNLKINKYEIINNNGEFIDDEINNQYIFKFNDLRTNRTTIGFLLNVENTTSNYQFVGRPELITKIPEEDIQFFKSLSNTILEQDKTNMPIYKKLGRWVHNYLKYNINMKGKVLTAKEIYRMKQGVCEHFTILYNTLLASQGIEAIKVSGYALDITENNILKENEFNKAIPYEDNTISSSKHAWSLAKIDGEWVPLDATWNMLNKNVPVTHIFENYGNSYSSMEYISGNKVESKTTKEDIKYIKN